jgi:hypothetical protein
MTSVDIFQSVSQGPGYFQNIDTPERMLNKTGGTVYPISRYEIIEVLVNENLFLIKFYIRNYEYISGKIDMYVQVYKFNSTETICRE